MTSLLIYPEHRSRRCDWTRPVERQGRCLREELHQRLWRLGFDAVAVPLLRQQCEVVQGAEQAAIPGPAERDLRHPRSFFGDVSGGDTDAVQYLAHGVRKHLRQPLAFANGNHTGSRERSLMKSRC